MPAGKEKGRVSSGAVPWDGEGGRNARIDPRVSGKGLEQLVCRGDSLRWRRDLIFISFQATRPTSQLVTLAFYFSRDEFLIFMTGLGNFQRISTRQPPDVLCIWSNGQGAQAGRSGSRHGNESGFPSAARSGLAD